MACEKENTDGGNCIADNMYCDKITTGAEDQALCNALLKCMETTHCWTDDPLKCLCGTAQDTACLTAANGLCMAEVFAATKATNGSDAGTRFYDIAYPSGYASQVVACRFGYCSEKSEPPNPVCK